MSLRHLRIPPTPASIPNFSPAQERFFTGFSPARAAVDRGREAVWEVWEVWKVWKVWGYHAEDAARLESAPYPAKNVATGGRAQTPAAPRAAVLSRSVRLVRRPPQTRGRAGSEERGKCHVPSVRRRKPRYGVLPTRTSYRSGRKDATTANCAPSGAKAEAILANEHADRRVVLWRIQDMLRHDHVTAQLAKIGRFVFTGLHRSFQHQSFSMV